MKLKTFLTKRGFTNIPLKANVVGHFEVEAKLNGVPIVLILDTGASGTVIDIGVANLMELDLKLQDTQGGGVGSQKMDIHSFQAKSLVIGSMELTEIEIYAMDLSHARASLSERGADGEIHGILGADLLIPCEAVIDYAEKTLFLKPH